MSALFPDTRPEAKSVLIRLLRQAPPCAIVSICFSQQNTLASQ